jgi:carboxypeptidase C (cathepsin A)
MTSEMRTALMLPTYTAAAFANKKLPPELQGDLQAALRQAEAWARTEYAATLARRDSVNDVERQATLAQLARFTGLDVGNFDSKTLSLGMEQFSRSLLADRNQVVGRYDSRLVGPLDPNERLYDPTRDPSLKEIISDVGVVRYFRNELQYKSDLQYQGPFGGGYPPPTAFRGDWMSVRWNRGSAGETTATRPGGTSAAPTAAPEQPLRRAMVATPGLRVLSACGYYDLVCSYAGNAHLASQLDTEFARNVIARGYSGGHAVYTDKSAQMELKRDVLKFMQNAAPRAPGRRPGRPPQK